MIKQTPTDEDLVAYIDGELSPADRANLDALLLADASARKRLHELEAAGSVFGEAMEAVLDEAPKLQLEAMLARLPAYRQRPRWFASRWTGVAALAAALAVFVAGMAVERPLPPGVGPGRAPAAETSVDSQEWRQVVAEYLTLYTAETIASMPDTADMREKELVSVGAKLGIALSPEQVALPDLSFRRAQFFEYEGTPLGQIAYLDPQSGPVALCIYGNGEGDGITRTEQREGLNIVYWSRNGRSFMLIGRIGVPRLQELAGTLSARLRG